MTITEPSPSLYNSPDLNVRLARIDDTARIGDLLVAGFPSYAYPETTENCRREAGRRNATKEQLIAFANTSLRTRKGNPEYWTKCLEEGLDIFVAELGLVGIVGYAAGKEWHSENQELQLAELHDIQVAEEFRMRGIGKRLLEQVCEQHQQRQNVGTFANFISWAPCRAFYEHIGAVHLGPFSSSKTASMSKESIQLDTSIAMVVHDSSFTLDSNENKELAHREIQSHIGI